jgi:hypothetical protein
MRLLFINYFSAFRLKYFNANSLGKLKNNYFLPPSPYGFNKPKKCTLELDLSQILIEVNNILPQYSHFIEQFRSIIVNTDANVIVDGSGSMSIDVPASMSDNEAEQLSKKLNVIDSLIRTRNDDLEKLLDKATSIESELSKKNTNYKSQILEKAQEFQRLKNIYKN